MFRNRDLILSVVVYGMASLCQISFDAIYPLTLMNSRHYGGFEMNALEEGWVATCAIFMQITSSTLCFVSSNSPLLPSLEQTGCVSRSTHPVSALHGWTHALGAPRFCL